MYAVFRFTVQIYRQIAMGKRGPKKKTAELPPLQTPQGVAGKKRTPTSSFDLAAGKDIYER